MKPNQTLIDMWTRAAHTYHESLAGSPGEAYLAERGLLDQAENYLLGYVREPAPGHEDRFKHHLSVPYITGAGVVAFKFRRLGAGSPKYTAPSGQRHHLFNVQAILEAVEQVLIVEGELDAIAASSVGLPAAAVPGVKAWKPHFARCFDGIGKVIIAVDNDVKEDGSNPGQEFAKRLSESLPNAVRVSLPEGHDINSTIQSFGAPYLTELVGSVE